MAYDFSIQIACPTLVLEPNIFQAAWRQFGMRPQEVLFRSAANLMIGLGRLTCCSPWENFVPSAVQSGQLRCLSKRKT